MQTKILISLAALVAAVVTVASAVHQLDVTNSSQPMHLASNPGGGGP